MEGHFTWFSWVPALLGVSHDNAASAEKFVVAVALGAAIVGVGGVATRRLRHEGVAQFIIPQNPYSLSGLVDYFVELFLAFHDSVLGKENRQYISLTGSIFLFVLLANLVGLIPGAPAITTTVWVNVGISLTAFLAFNAYGMKAHGVVNYLKHFCGPVLFLAPFIFCLEIFSTCLRIVTLNLRLYWNITADHMVLGAFSEMAPLGVPIILYGLGTFVSFMQAFIFTTLTMVYILLATEHEEDH